MKNYIVIIFASIILVGCKSFDPKLLNPTSKALEAKLPAMENSVENDLYTMIVVEGNVLGPNTQDIKTLFDRHVSEVVTNPYGKKRGTLVLKVTTIETRVLAAPYFLNFIFTLGVGTLFGMPVMGAVSLVEVKLEVLDGQRTLIGAYRGSGRKKMYSGLYYSKYARYTQQRVTYIEATKQAINEATSKLASDVDRLNEELAR